MTQKEKLVLRKALWLIKNNGKWFDATAALRVEKDIEGVLGKEDLKQLNKEFDKEMMTQPTEEELRKLYEE